MLSQIVFQILTKLSQKKWLLIDPCWDKYLRNFFSLILFGQWINTVRWACSRLSFCTSENLFFGVLSSEPVNETRHSQHTHVKFKASLGVVYKDFTPDHTNFILIPSAFFSLIRGKLYYSQSSYYHSLVITIKLSTLF